MDTPINPSSMSSYLAALPRLPDLVIEGSVRFLQTPITIEGAIHDEVACALFLESGTGAVRSTQIMAPDQNEEITEGALAALLAALGSPSGGSGDAGLPGLVRVDVPQLAQLVRQVLEPFGVRVELATLPAVDEASASLQEYLREQADLANPFRWGVPPGGGVFSLRGGRAICHAGGMGPSGG